LARLLLAAPRFALLDRIGTALTPPQVEQVLDPLSRNAITCLSVDHGESRLDRYNAVLDLHEGGSWEWIPLQDGRPIEEGIIRGNGAAAASVAGPPSPEDATPRGTPDAVERKPQSALHCLATCEDRLPHPHANVINFR